MRHYIQVSLWIIVVIALTGVGFYEKYGESSHSESESVYEAKEKLTEQLSGNKPFKESTISPEPLPKESIKGTFSKVNGEVTPKPSDDKFLQNSPDSLEQLPINKVAMGMQGKLISVVGSIVSRYDHKNGHTFLTVSDDTGKISIPIFANKHINVSQFQVGRTFRFTGQVDVFKGELEIIPRSAKDIETEYREIEDFPTITQKDVGKTVKIQATVLSSYRHPQGHIFLTVCYGKHSAEIQIPLFSSLELQDEGIGLGSILSVRGKVKLYKGRLQVVPDRKEDIHILKTSYSDTPKLLAIGKISINNRGEMVQLRGYVNNIYQYEGHTFFEMSDQEGNKLKAVLFSADTKEIMGRKLKVLDAEKERFPIRVLAYVSLYKGELNLIIDKVYNEY